MHIEYVLIEKQTPDKPDVSKERIVDIFKECYSTVDGEKISILGKRKSFDLPYIIRCTSATSDESTDHVYNITIACEHNDKMKNAELLEKAHVLFKGKIDGLQGYHIIVADDELSEYYCNRLYPHFQKFERQLRHLIFKIVTKAYGHLWTTKTLSSEQKRSLKDDIKSRSGSTKEDMLIEAALHEMTMGQLIDYLFYGNTETNLSDLLDEYYSAAALKALSKEELIELVERGRRKSVWNLYLSDDFDVLEPQAKLKELKGYRNSVAHCKQLYFENYSKAKSCLDIFIPKIEAAIIKANIQEPRSIRDVLCGFGEFTIGLSKLAQSVGQAITPALQQMAEIGASICRVYQSEAITSALNVVRVITESISPSLFTAITDIKPYWVENPLNDIIAKQQELMSSLTINPIENLLVEPDDTASDIDEEELPEEETYNADA